MPSILVFSENNALALNFLPKGVQLARDMAVELNAAILGPGARSRATAYFALGAAKAYVSEDERLSRFDAGVYSQALFQIMEKSQAEAVLLLSTRRGREVASTLAQMAKAGCLTNVLNVSAQAGKLVTSRYGLGGTTIVSAYLETPKKIIAVLPQNFEGVETKPVDGQIVGVDLKLDKPAVTVTERKERTRESVDIEKAAVLVCIGRGLKRKEDLGLIQHLARAAKGEIGCSKEVASNLGWLSEDRIVGMSGKRCKPKLLFSIGISGQSQHVSGIVDAKVIVAINNDRNAPIFRVCDYGVVGDLYKVVPELIEKLK